MASCRWQPAIAARDDGRRMTQGDMGADDQVEELKEMFARLLETQERFHEEINLFTEHMTGEMRKFGEKMNSLEQKALLRKTSVVSMFPWRFLLAMVFSIVGGLFIYDVNMHGSFKGSKTGQVLNDLGVIAVCNHAWIRIKIYSLKLYSWSEENIPIYFSMLCKFCDPYIQLFWNQLYLWGLFIADQTADIRTYLNEKIPQLLEWLNNNLPVLIQNKSELFKEVWSSIQHYALVVGTWLQENVFVGKLSSENLQKCTMDTIETVQHYTVTTYEWIKEQVLAYT